MRNLTDLYEGQVTLIHHHHPMYSDRVSNDLDNGSSPSRHQAII